MTQMQLFPRCRQAILALLLLHPEQRYHVREVARLTGFSAPPVGKELNALADLGFLSREQVGNQLVFQANRTCPIFEELASIARKTFGLADVVRHALAPLQDRIQCAFIFGSLASDRATSGSDIDLMIIGSLRFEDITPMLPPLEQALGRDVNPKLYTPNAWRAALRKGDAFLENVVSRPKIFLLGSDTELDELGKEAQ